jgi:hypothetical protein
VLCDDGEEELERVLQVEQQETFGPAPGVGDQLLGLEEQASDNEEAFVLRRGQVPHEKLLERRSREYQRRHSSDRARV